MRNEDVNMKDAPNPYIKLNVKNIQIRLHEYEVNNKPTAHVRPPAMAVKRHPIVLQRIDPKGQRKNVKAIVRDPSQTENKRNTHQHETKITETLLLVARIPCRILK